MNRNLTKALLLIGVLGSLTAVAHGQQGLPPFFPPPNRWVGDPLDLDWVIDCEDPTSTTSPYSTDYGIEYQYDSLFGAVMGVSGTVNFSKICFPPSGVTLNMPGRLGFYIGTDPVQTLANGTQNPTFAEGGSLQDDLAGQGIDDGLTLTFGGYTGVSGNFAIANIVQTTTATTNGTATTTTKLEYFGKNAIDTAYWGESNRYFVGETTASLGARVILQVDILGDTARCTWKIQNTTATVGIGLGLYFGQWVFMQGPQGPHSADYVTAPGMQPMNTDTRFRLLPKANQAVPELPLPPYVDFGMYQSWAYGLQIVLGPSTQIPDQTQADGIDLGKNGFLLGSMTASDGAMPDVLLPDTTMLLGGNAYVEKFEATPVSVYSGTTIGATTTPGPDTRVIVAYYRSTWSTSDYSQPYSVVLDAPPVVATTPGNPGSFQNAPFSLIVHVDDTLGFSTNQQQVPLEDVEIDLDLPAGMTDANNANSNHMVQYLNSVPAQTITHVVFQVAVDPTLFGSQQYTVTVKPNPGPTKVVTGTVVIATQPYLQLTGTANLVTAPWQFGSSDWATIIGANTNLVVDRDFQVFGWDATAQDYVLQTDPQRGLGSFVVTNQNVGFVKLGGNPQQVQDLQTGAPQIILQPGWNLIANPYNYAIPLGQLVGVPEANNQNSFTFTELANENYVSGSLAYWDSLSQGYEYTSSFSDLIQPNTGYWLYVVSNLPVTLEYRPVFQAFLPGLVDNLNNNFAKVKGSFELPASPTWSLQLAARSTNSLDATTSIGQTTTAALAASLTKYKAPVAPLKNAISSSILAEGTKRPVGLARALTVENQSSKTWTWNIYTQNAGPVTLTWPNMSTVPSNVQVKLIDPKTGVQRELRQTSSISFNASAQSTKSYELVVTTGPVLPVIESVTTSASKTLETITYDLSVNATTTVNITHSGSVVRTLVINRADNLGKSLATWNFADSANRPVKNGTYQAVVTSTPSGGSAATKSVSFTVNR
jgi:hypothetical protein